MCFMRIYTKKKLKQREKSTMILKQEEEDDCVWADHKPLLNERHLITCRSLNLITIASLDLMIFALLSPVVAEMSFFNSRFTVNFVLFFY